MLRSFLGLRSAAGPSGAMFQRTMFRRANLRLFSSGKVKQPGKMKTLVKEYGWTATGVYVAFMCVDLPLCYLLVHSAGQERIETWEIAARRAIGADTEREHTYIHKAAAGGKSLFLAELAVAYILHKALIVVRVPLTVWITPAVASKLGQWGFNVRRAMPTVDKEQLASQIASKAADSNSATVKKAAEAISAKNGAPAARILDEASSASTASDALKKAAQAAKQEAKQEPRHGDFGKPPSPKRRWWWFF